VPRGRRARVFTISGVLLAFAIVWAGVWTVGISGRAQTLAAELQSTAGAAQTTIGSADADAITKLRTNLAEAAPRARDLRDDLWPLRIAGALVGWYPVIGDNVKAAPDMANRLTHDVVAALEILEAAERLLLTFDQIPTDANGINGALASLPSEDEIREIRGIVLASDEALAKAEDTADGVHDRRLWGPLEREATKLRAQEGELRDLIDWTLLATDSLLALARLADVAGGLTTVLDTGDASALTLETLQLMPELEASTLVASRTVSAAVASMPDAVANSSIGSNLRDLEPVLSALHATARSGALVANVVTPAFGLIETTDAGLFGANSGLIPAIELIGTGSGNLREAHKLLQQAQIDLSLAAPGIRSESAASAADALLLLSRDFELAVSLLRDLPDLAPDALGKTGERNYLVLAESADEIRASGGFVSGAWILSFKDGGLLDSAYEDIVKVDDLTNLDLYPSPPALLANNMDASVWLMRDVSWEPDFPSVADSAAEILAIGQDGMQVDGVIAMTQWAMIDLVEALGAIDTPSGPVAPGELLTALESGTDGEGREFMDTLFRGLLDQVSSPAINGKMFQLARSASKTLAEKQVLVHLFDDDLQKVVTRAGWDGAAHRESGDRIEPVDSNVGWSKVDRNIKRSLDYEVVLSRSGRSTGKVTVRYENMSNEDSSSCDSQRMERGASYEELKNACYWNLLRIYTAEGASLTSATELPLPANSIIGGLGLSATGDDTVAVGVGPGGGFVTGLVVVPAGEIVETSFDIDLPENVVDWTDDVSTYTLHLVAQPGTLGRATHVTIELPPGQMLARGSTSPSGVDGRLVSFDLPLTEDAVITLAMRSVESASNQLRSISDVPIAGLVP
jgi:hypothetical protein